ncbi:MAG: porin [Gammaproteobacteria bacterium]|nr:porin [Gammaproteobacteria bacterium]
MNINKNHRNLCIGIALTLPVLAAMETAHGKSLTEATTLLEAAGDPNESSFMKGNNLRIGGWANAGITYNAAAPDNGFNGPVTFGDREGEFQLNQLNLFVQRTVATEGNSFDLGGRFDVMFGTDAIFTQAYGVPAYDVNTARALRRNHWDLNLLGGRDNRFYDLAIPQAYLEAYIPIGNGLNVKAGHFYTPIGYETVPAPDNFFYTHAYTMQYGEPFTHTGVMGNYTVDDNWAVMGGVVTGSATGGWDGGWDKHLGNWAGLMGATWTSPDKNTSVNVSGTYGGTSEQSSKDWAMYSIVAKHNITEKMHLMVQHDHGFADGTFDFATNRANAIDAEWYGVNTHLTYDVMDNLTAGVRGEWFRDQNGFRVCSPGRVYAATYDANSVTGSYAANFLSSCSAASYYAVTAGVNWKPLKWLNIRPNVRYDWADGARPFGNNKQDQFLFSTDMNIGF